MEHRLGEKASGPCICICCGDNCDKQHSDTLHLHTLVADNTEAVFCVDCITSMGMEFAAKLLARQEKAIAHLREVSKNN